MPKPKRNKEKGGEQPPTPASTLYSDSEAMEAINKLGLLRDEINRLLRVLTDAGFTVDINIHNPVTDDIDGLKPFPQLDVRVYTILLDTNKTGQQPAFQDPLDENWDSPNDEEN